MDRCGRFDPATRDVDVEQTQIGRIAERRGYGGRRAFLFRAEDLTVRLEAVPRARDVRLANLRVVDGERLVDDLALGARDAQDCLGELVQRELVRVADVHRQM